MTAREPAFGVGGRDFALGVEEELLARARPFARELGSDGALEQLERVFVDGAGAYW